ncbi:hypothetical protein ACFQ07_17790, partial [Actinomadura adrarensis]
RPPAARPSPSVTVYGDGRIIVLGRSPSGTESGRSVLLEARLTRDAYRDMYKEALVAGLGTSRSYRNTVMDGGSTRVEFLSDGRRHVTRFQEADGFRTMLIERLLDRLRALPRLNGDELTGPAKQFHDDRIALIVRRPESSNKELASPWPLRPLARGERSYCFTVSGNDAVTAQRLAAPPRSVNWRSGGHTYELTFRPLLPDENCGDVHQRFY